MVNVIFPLSSSGMDALTAATYSLTGGDPIFWYHLQNNEWTPHLILSYTILRKICYVAQLPTHHLVECVEITLSYSDGVLLGKESTDVLLGSVM